jgi:hypothetical protein
MPLTGLLGALVLLRRSLWTSTRLSAVAPRTASLGVSRFGGSATRTRSAVPAGGHRLQRRG